VTQCSPAPAGRRPKIDLPLPNMAFDRPENDDDPDVFTLFGYKALLHVFVLMIYMHHNLSLKIKTKIVKLSITCIRGYPNIAVSCRNGDKKLEN